VLEDCESTSLSDGSTADPAVADVSTVTSAGNTDHESRLRQNSILTFLSGPDEVWWASVLLLVLASLLGVCVIVIVFLINRASDANKKYRLLLQGSGTDSDIQTNCSSSSPDSEMYVKTNKKNATGNASKDDPYAQTQKQLKDICAESASSVEMFLPTSSPLTTSSSNFVRDNTHLSTRSMGGYSRVHSTTDSNIYSQDPKELVRLAKLSRTNSTRTCK
ncbi:unnamed protein product, partial [Meganyctiphanes norvegica]